MGNKVKYNLKNVYAAKMTETETEGVKSFSYTNHFIKQEMLKIFTCFTF